VEVIEHAPIFRLPGIACQWSPFECHRAGFVPDHVTYTWLVMIVLVGLAFVASRDLRLVPRGLQNFFEVVLEQIQQLIDDVIGPEGRPYLPLIATLAIFILAANLAGLVPGMNGPTTNLNTTAACALVVVFAYHGLGIRKQGLVTYVKHFMGPVVWLAPLMFPIEIISHLARPLSLTLRLFGNMFGGHMLLAIIFFLMGLDGLLGWALSGNPLGVVAGGLGSAVVTVFTVGFLYPLKILVSFLQAFIFVMLTMLYISGAIEEAEHHGGEPHPAHH